MIAEIVSVGTELLMGQIVNTDAQFLARRLAALGITMYRQSTVGDNPGRVKEAVREALSRADLVITTGGLGPTEDDLTKEMVAEALGLPVQLLWVALAVPVTALGASLYQTADLGIAPYDYLSLGLRDYTPVPYFGCRVFTDALCALLCWLLGGLVGIGTLICAFCLGPFIQFFNGLVSERVLHYKPGGQ